jgi:hypothetical protein
MNRRWASERDSRFSIVATSNKRIEKLIRWNRFHPFLEEYVVSLPLLAPDKYSAISSAIG